MDEVTVRESAWWHSPRLIAAAACFLLGSAVLAAGLVPRLAPPAAPALAGDLADDPLASLGDTAPEPEGGRDGPREDLVVYVSGAVAAPDVYRLPPGARVKDAVAAAGGLRPDAAGAKVNLAEPVSDAQHIHIPDRGAPAAAEDPAAAPVGAGLIDLNQASAAELEELPGVGKVLAERIIARREEQGPFLSVDDLRDVTGVGAKLFEQIAPLVSAGR